LGLACHSLGDGAPQEISDRKVDHQMNPVFITAVVKPMGKGKIAVPQLTGTPSHILVGYLKFNGRIRGNGDVHSCMTAVHVFGLIKMPEDVFPGSQSH
jgi:hypothetical protein